MNIVGNFMSGQVTGETAKHLSERFGKILQDRQSIAINRNDTSITNSKQLELAVPASRIASLSSGEFVGLVSDNPDQKIALKAFCAEIMNDHNSLAEETKRYKDLPQFSAVRPNDVLNAYKQIKKEIATIVETEMERLIDTPDLNDLLVRKQ